MAIPIWKDTFLEISSNASPFTYSMECDGTTIFNGKAWAAPDEETIRINVNHIAQDFLKIDFPNLSGISQTGVTTFTNNEAVRTFSVYNENHGLVASYDFILDWSYRNVSYGYNLNEIINYHGTNGMYYFRGNTYNNRTTTEVTKSPSALWYYGLPDLEYHTYDGSYCGNGALYYLNRFGNWCSFLIEGNILRKDEYNRYSITRAYDNNTLNRGEMVYNNVITPSWELHTSYLKDDESKRLAFHLLSSNQVYFHDLIEDRIYPVVINDASGEYKTVKNQGKKMVSYTISVTASQKQHNLG